MLFPTAPSMGDMAREVGFAECVGVLRRTLIMAPVGWVLVAGLSYGRAPVRGLLVWIGLFAATWLYNLAALRRIDSADARCERDAPTLIRVAVLDGVAWGLLVLLVMAHDRILDSWLAVVLCGVASVNAPSYITYRPAFRALVGSIWITALVSAALVSEPLQAAPQLAAGLTVYLGLLVFSMRIISQRVIEGIRLQLENAALASQLEVALEGMRRQASTDALTGQLNRRALDAALEGRLAEARERGARFALLMIDVDHFKQVNDQHGHHVGDQALRAVAERIGAQLRSGDACARYGGEEFVVLLGRADLDAALEAAERVRCAVAATPLPTTPPITVTVSIGVEEWRPAMSAEALLASADAAVYLAKRDGRNLVRRGPSGAASAPACA
ncbi:MAG: GGDEF domain-containing protein [Burkholderiales bacterium]|nr:GGDEF domain-containing protein [Burkholderiales bacterium]MDE2452921.1 GGDEF domain-containing protein [Burkholderiales bacterium]